MGKVISQNQSAFVSRRLIPKNLIDAHEAFHDLKRKERGGKEFMAMKLDMNKAYEWLEWNFLEKVLLAYGFDPRWVAMVLKLVTSVTYRYKINGFPSEIITPTKRSKTGRPLITLSFLSCNGCSLLSH